MSGRSEDGRGALQPARIAVDLGAESCRVSLLRWRQGEPGMTLVHRFSHGPVLGDSGLRWALGALMEGVEAGLEKAAARAPEGVGSIGVDGWAVDYVRLEEDGVHGAEPFCYRDVRAVLGEEALHQRLPARRLRELTGIQQQALNTVYQMQADAHDGRKGRWLNLPEYLLFRWGGEPVAEYTNATHTGLLDVEGRWCEEIFAALGEAMDDAPRLVPPGTDVGAYAGRVTALRGARLIAPCCHDTASAVAAIADAGEDWAYISSGTWSLIGTVLERACTTEAAAAANFTNLGAAGGRRLFHKGVPGMWPLQQCLRRWQGTDVTDVVVMAAGEAPIEAGELLDLGDPRLASRGDMPAMINAQRVERGLMRLERPAAVARLLFESLAAEYATVLRTTQELTGRRLRRVYVVGGGSQNELLNWLTAERTGLEVRRGAVESSTVGNFALQIAATGGEVSAAAVREAAKQLASASLCIDRV